MRPGFFYISNDANDTQQKKIKLLSQETKQGIEMHCTKDLAILDIKNRAEDPTIKVFL
jgi:hypothetical protein